VVPLVPKQHRDRRERRRVHSSLPHGSVVVGTRGIVSRPATTTLAPGEDSSRTDEEMVVLVGAAPGGSGLTNPQGSRVGEDGPCAGKASPGFTTWRRHELMLQLSAAALIDGLRLRASTAFGWSGEEHLAPSVDEVRCKLLAAQRKRGESSEVRLQVS
jgi:hypothetical protein